MASINEATIYGNVGKDPEIRTMNSGDRVANLSIATSEKWTDKQSGEKKEATEWHRVTIWGPLVDIVDRYVKKGSKLYIRGKLKTRKYTDSSGVEKYTTEIVLQGFDAKLVLMGDPQGGGGSDRQDDRGGGQQRSQGGGSQGGGTSRYGQSDSGAFDPDLDDEIPF